MFLKRGRGLRPRESISMGSSQGICGRAKSTALKLLLLEQRVKGKSWLQNQILRQAWNSVSSHLRTDTLLATAISCLLYILTTRAFIHSCNDYLLNMYCAQGTLLQGIDQWAKQTKSPYSSFYTLNMPSLFLSRTILLYRVIHLSFSGVTLKLAMWFALVSGVWVDVIYTMSKKL